MQNPAFQKAFYRHYEEIQNHLSRIVGTQEEAEDLSQMVFLRLHQNFDQLDHEKLRSWLYRVATNLGFNAVRNRKRFRNWQQKAKEQPENLFTKSPTPSESLSQKDERRLVQQVLAKLPERDARLLYFYYAGLKSYKELAEEFQVKPSSIGTLLARAKKSFQKVYQEQALHS